MNSDSNGIIKDQLSQLNFVSSKCQKHVFQDCQNVNPDTLIVSAKLTSPDWQIGFYGTRKEVNFKKIVLLHNAKLSSIVRNCWQNDLNKTDGNIGYYSLISCTRSLDVYDEVLINDLANYVEGHYQVIEPWSLCRLNNNMEVYLERVEESVLQRISNHFKNLNVQQVKVELKNENVLFHDCGYYAFMNCSNVIAQKIIVNCKMGSYGVLIMFLDITTAVQIPNITIEARGEFESIIRNCSMNSQRNMHKYFTLLEYVKTLTINNNPKAVCDLANYVSGCYVISNQAWVIKRISCDIHILINNSNFPGVYMLGNHFSKIDINGHRINDGVEKIKQNILMCLRKSKNQKIPSPAHSVFSRRDLTLPSSSDNVCVFYVVKCEQISRLTIKQRLLPEQFICFFGFDKPPRISTVCVASGGDLRCALQNVCYNNQNCFTFSLLAEVRLLEISCNEQAVRDLADYLCGKYRLSDSWCVQQLIRDIEVRIDRVCDLSSLRRVSDHFASVRVGETMTELLRDNSIAHECERHTFTNCRNATPMALTVVGSFVRGCYVCFSDADGEVAIPQLVIEGGRLRSITHNTWSNRGGGEGDYSLLQHAEALVIRNSLIAVYDLLELVSENKYDANPLQFNSKTRLSIELERADEPHVLVAVAALTSVFESVLLNGEPVTEDALQLAQQRVNECLGGRTNLSVGSVQQVVVSLEELRLGGRPVRHVLKHRDIKRLIVQQKVDTDQLVCFHGFGRAVVVDTVCIGERGNLRCMLQNATCNGGQCQLFSLLASAKALQLYDNPEVIRELLDYAEGRYPLNENWVTQNLSRDMEVAMKCSEEDVAALDRLAHYFRRVTVLRVKQPLRAKNTLKSACGRVVFTNCRNVMPQKLVMDARCPRVKFLDADDCVRIQWIMIAEKGLLDSVVYNSWYENRAGDQMKCGRYSLLLCVETLVIRNNQKAVRDLADYVLGAYEATGGWIVHALSGNMQIVIYDKVCTQEIFETLKGHFANVQIISHADEIFLNQVGVSNLCQHVAQGVVDKSNYDMLRKDPFLECNYTVTKKLWRGMFSDALLCKSRATGLDYVIEVVNTEEPSRTTMPQKDQIKSILQHIDEVKDNRHENILEHDVLQIGGRTYVATEYCDEGTLDDLIRRNKQGLPIGQALQYFAQLCVAIDRVHGRETVHADINPSRVFLKSSANRKTFYIKIYGFNLCGVVKARSQAPQMAYEMAYKAPEVLSGRKPDCKCDVWSMGCILYEMCTGCRLVQTNDVGELVKRVLHMKIPLIKNRCDGVVQNLLNETLQIDPRRRCSLASLLEMPHMKQIIYDIRQDYAMDMINKRGPGYFFLVPNYQDSRANRTTARLAKRNIVDGDSWCHVFVQCRGVEPSSMVLNAGLCGLGWQVGFFDADGEVHIDEVHAQEGARLSSLVRNYWWNGKHGEERRDGYYSLLRHVKTLNVRDDNFLNELADYAEGKYRCYEYWCQSKINLDMNVQIKGEVSSAAVYRLKRYFRNISCEYVTAKLQTENKIDIDCKGYVFTCCRSVVPARLVVNAEITDKLAQLKFNEANNKVIFTEIAINELGSFDVLFKTWWTNNKDGDKLRTCIYNIIQDTKILTIKNNQKALCDLACYIADCWEIDQPLWRAGELNRQMTVVVLQEYQLSTIESLNKYFENLVVDETTTMLRTDNRVTEECQKYVFLNNDIAPNSITIGVKLSSVGPLVDFHGFDKEVYIRNITIDQNGELSAVIRNRWCTEDHDSYYYSLLQRAQILTIKNNMQAVRDLVAYVNNYYDTGQHWRQHELNMEMEIWIYLNKSWIDRFALQSLDKHFKKVYKIASDKLQTENLFDIDCLYYTLIDCMGKFPRSLTINGKSKWLPSLVFKDADGEVHIPELTIKEGGQLDILIYNEWNNGKDDGERAGGAYSLLSCASTLAIKRNSNALNDLASYLENRYNIPESAQNMGWVTQKLNTNLKFVFEGLEKEVHVIQVMQYHFKKTQFSIKNAQDHRDDSFDVQVSQDKEGRCHSNEEKEAFSHKGKICINEKYVIDALDSHNYFRKMFLATAIAQSSNNIFAIKAFKMFGNQAKQHQRQLIKSELETLQRLSHPFIVGYKANFVFNNSLHIVLEDCGQTTLSDLIKDHCKRNRHITQDIVLSCFIQLCMAVEHVHDNKIVHRNIRPDSIYILREHSNSTGLQIKLSGFQHSRIPDGQKQSAKLPAGDLLYTAPEVIRGGDYSYKCDVWSLGCILYEMCTFKRVLDDNTLRSIRQGSTNFQPPTVLKEGVYDDQIQSILNVMLQANPEERCSMYKILMRPGIFPICDELQLRYQLE